MSVRRLTLAGTLFLGCLVPFTASAVASAGPAVARNLCAPPADTVGPVANSVTFGTPSIDLNSGSRVQTITVDASDTSGNGAPSGVARISLEIQGVHFYGGAQLTLTSGTSTSGNWTGSVTVSKYARAGAYSIISLDVIDAAGNQQYYPGYGRVPYGPNALSLHPADDPTFTVTGTPASPPPRRPAGTLAGLSISRYHVNTTVSRRHVHISARFAGASPRLVSVQVDSTKRSRSTRFVYLRSQLRDHRGNWTGTVIVPRWLGRQSLQITLFDNYGSHYRPSGRYYDSQQLHRLHFAAALAVVSRVDHSRPTLTSLSVSPNPIDSTAGAQQVTVTATATDTGSGVRSITVGGYIRNGINGVIYGSYPFSAAGIGYLSSQNFNVRLRKTPQGTWVGITTVRQCVPSGTYKLSVDLSDVAGNYRYDSTGRLARAHITSTVDVTSKHGDIAPPYVYSAATYGAAHELFLNFSEGVTEVSTSTLSVYPLSPRSSRYTSPISIATIVCSNGTTTVPCSGGSGLATSAVLTIPGLVPGQKYEVWANLNQVVPQLTDGNSNPMNWNYASTQVIDA